MAGHVFKRCTSCGGRFDADDHGDRCPGGHFTWAFRIDITPESSGKRTQRRGGGFPTRRAAERAMRDLLGKLDTASYVAPHHRTVRSFLTDEWLPAQLPPRTSANRYRNKRNGVRRIAPLIGDLQLQGLTAADLERAYSVLLRGGKAPEGNEGRQYAPATVLQTHGVIRQALQDAVKWGLLERNVADQADPPSHASVSADRRRAMRVWTPAQLGNFLEAAAEHWLFPMWLLAATTGLRRGELAGLVKDSLDLAASVLVVSWQLVPEEDPDRPNHTRPVHKQVTKTAASSRSINLDTHTTNELAAWIDRQRHSATTSVSMIATWRSWTPAWWVTRAGAATRPSCSAGRTDATSTRTGSATSSSGSASMPACPPFGSTTSATPTPRCSSPAANT